MADEYHCVQNDPSDTYWLEIRRNFGNNCRVNGSDAGKIAGLCSQTSPEQHFFSILNKDKFEGNAMTRKGHLFEPKIADLYAYIMDVELEVSGYCTPSNDNPNFKPGDAFFFGCSLDRKRKDGGPDVEIKAPYHAMYKEEIKPSHMAQLQLQMAVRNKPCIHYIAAFYENIDKEKEIYGGLKDFFIIKVYFNQEYWQRLYTVMKQFSLHLFCYSELGPYIQSKEENEKLWPHVIQERIEE